MQGEGPHNDTSHLCISSVFLSISRHKGLGLLCVRQGHINSPASVDDRGQLVGIRSLFSMSTTWVLGLRLRSPDLVTGTFTHWPISTAPHLPSSLFSRRQGLYSASLVRSGSFSTSAPLAWSLLWGIVLYIKRIPWPLHIKVNSISSFNARLG